MTDEQAMNAVKQGDVEKAAILYERYKKSLLNFFLYHNAPHSDARDMVQQVFWRLLRYGHSYQDNANFRTWIYEVSRNVLYDFFKKQKPFVGLDQLADMANEETNDDDYQYLHQALARLPENFREVLVLSRFEQMTYDEIGQVLGLSVANVKVRVFRALQQLRSIYFEMNER